MLKDYNEKLWESYVKKYPDKFFDEQLKFFKQQHKVKSGVIDLVFKDSNKNIVIVELQIKALDRVHFAKVLEYKFDLQKKYKNKKVRLILLCNEIDKKRSDYIDMHKKQYGLEIEIKIISISKVKKIIQSIHPTIGFKKEKKVIKSRTKNKDLLEIIENQENLFLERIKKLENDNKIKNRKNKADLIKEIIKRIYPKKELGDIIWGHYRPIYSDLEHHGYVEFNTAEECVNWKEKLRDIIFKYAEKSVEHLNDPKNPERKYNLTKCPLCDQTPYRPYGEQGWLLYYVGKDSLDHHLGRSKSDNINCSLYEILTKDVNERFSELIYIERKNKEQIIQKRRFEENLYLINREDEPKLFDDDFNNYSYLKPKNLNDINIINKVEKRLFEIGFKKNVNDRIISYTYEFIGQNGSFFIFADPRQPNKISFKVYSNSSDLEASLMIRDDAKFENLKKMFEKKINQIVIE
tara:strand:- start:543 stop:1931 length:1389 start_codon:yes stop_codon:yes gene_type:complete